MIKVENLNKKFGEVQAISNVSFEVGAGEIVGFLGPNGAGKTTTMRILTGFLPASSGTVKIDGFDVMEESLAVRKRIGYLPESNPLYLNMVVESFLRFGAELKGVNREDRQSHINEIIEKCGLKEMRQEIISRLSKGYRQRVGLAQALIGDPRVLILDEPTVGLDPRQIIEIRELIKRLGQERTIILSTHILPEVNEVCKRVIIMNEGRIVAKDTTENLTAKLVGAERVSVKVRGPKDQILARLKQVPGVVAVMDRGKTEENVESIEITSKIKTDIRELVAKAIVEGGWGLVGLERIRMNLEEVFLKLTTKEEK